jgi:hypothetical protein
MLRREFGQPDEERKKSGQSLGTAVCLTSSLLKSPPKLHAAASNFFHDAARARYPGFAKKRSIRDCVDGVARGYARLVGRHLSTPDHTSAEVHFAPVENLERIDVALIREAAKQIDMAKGYEPNFSRPPWSEPQHRRRSLIYVPSDDSTRCSICSICTKCQEGRLF